MRLLVTQNYYSILLKTMPRVTSPLGRILLLRNSEHRMPVDDTPLDLNEKLIDALLP